MLAHRRPAERNSGCAERLLVLDRGNRALKAALFDGGAIAERWREERPRIADSLRRIEAESARVLAEASREFLTPRERSHLARLLSGSVMFHGAAFSSVSPRWAKEIRSALRGRGVSRILEVNSRILLPFAVLVERPAKVGPDRLAAAAGIVASGEREGIIVDAGTAITVDVLARKGFLGGAIMPGEHLMYRALHEGTAVLPLIAAKGKVKAPPGRCTEEAIAAGVKWGIAGAVKELVARSRGSLSKGTRVWVTGGGGALLAAELGRDARYDPDLVFRGLRFLFDLNYR